MRHYLSPTNRDNMLNSDRATLVVGIIKGYEIEISKIISWEIRDRMVNMNISLAFPSLLTQLCLDQGV